MCLFKRWSSTSLLLSKTVEKVITRMMGGPVLFSCVCHRSSSRSESRRKLQKSSSLRGWLRSPSSAIEAIAAGCALQTAKFEDAA